MTLLLRCARCCRRAYDVNEGVLSALLHADPENGTTPAAIIQYLQSQNFTVSASVGMTIADVMRSIDRGVPVMLALQAWPDELPVNWSVLLIALRTTPFMC